MTYKNQENIVTCPHCKAYYDKTLDWYVGNYEGTSSDFIPRFRIESGKCPVCLKVRE